MSGSSEDLVWKEIHHLNRAAEAHARGDMAAVARNNIEAWFAANRERKRLKSLEVRTGVPKNKNYPVDAVQCDNCGGWGCNVCGDKGWFPAGHPGGRKCERPACDNPIPPTQIAVYCSNDCAARDTFDESD